MSHSSVIYFLDYDFLCLAVLSLQLNALLCWLWQTVILLFTDGVPDYNYIFKLLNDKVFKKRALSYFGECSDYTCFWSDEAEAIFIGNLGFVVNKRLGYE